MPTMEKMGECEIEGEANPEERATTSVVSGMGGMKSSKDLVEDTSVVSGMWGMESSNYLVEDTSVVSRMGGMELSKDLVEDTPVVSGMGGMESSKDLVEDTSVVSGMGGMELSKYLVEDTYVVSRMGGMELSKDLVEDTSVVSGMGGMESSKDLVEDTQRDNNTETIFDDKVKDASNGLEETHETQESSDSEASDSFICDSEDDMSEYESKDESNAEVPLTDAEVEELITEFLDVESKAAEAQESLEKESLEKVKSEVEAELSKNFQGEELEAAVSEEMETYIEMWESTLNELETESSLLLEQLDGAGVELPKLFRMIESQAGDRCSTETWKRMAHWVGGQLSSELDQAINNAENYLQSCRPIRRRHGRVMEEGASGFLAKKLPADKQITAVENSEGDWAAFSEIVQSTLSSQDRVSFGSKNWASVYLASTPQQASLMGLNLPGVDEVEEIDEIPMDSCDPFYADAIANEKAIDLSEEQKRNFRKVREEDDAKTSQKLQLELKKRRQWRKCSQKEIHDQSLLSDQYCAERGKKILHDADNVGCSTSKECQILPAVDDIERNDQKVQTFVSDGDDDLLVLHSVVKDTSGLVKREREPVDKVQEFVDVIDVDSAPSCSSQRINGHENFHCTVCRKVLSPSELCRHPLLEVISCKSCHRFIKGMLCYKDSNAAENFCRWCGKSGELVKCESCCMFFCVTCIKKPLDGKCIPEPMFSNWQCYCCSPSQLKEFVMDYRKALVEFAVPDISINTDSSESDIDQRFSIKKRMKKRIRRILEDTELEEKTKEKIALEKARQEHLKIMQLSGKSLGHASTTLDRRMMKATEVKVLGDAISGYIVNFAREDGEKPIRIPPSISGKLKPHQISGIRFMWENIVQSVHKMKSGDAGLGCILAHTMGLGKTFQVIAFLYAALRLADIGLRKAIIVTPVNVLHNWRQEFIKWKPIELKALRVFMMDSVPREKRVDLMLRWANKGGILLIGYSAFRNLCLGKHVKDKSTALQISHLLTYEPDILICDEAHMIKNRRADITLALKQVKTQRRIALTGSPLQNNLMEYYCMVDFVREGFLGSCQEFRNRFQNPIENGQHANATTEDVKIMNQRSHILYEQLKGFVHRMDLNVVKNDLPPKTVFVITVKLSPLQRKLYKKFLDVHGFTNDKAASDRPLMKRCFFSGYQALAQIWNHPGLLQLVKEHKYNARQEDSVENFLMDDSSSDDNVEASDMPTGDRQEIRANQTKKDDGVFHEEVEWWEDYLPEKIYKEVDCSGKMVLLLDILSMSYEVGDKVLVFSQSLPTLDLIELFLSRIPRKEREGKYWKQGKDWYRLDGRTDGSERQRLVEKFNDPTNRRVKCTLISTRAGSLGINLHAANRVVIVDGSWNPTHDLQAIFRVWRYGQIKPVYAYRLMAHGTMEEKIYKRQVTKEGLAARVVDRQQIYRTMSREEVLHLFDFGDDEAVDDVAYNTTKLNPVHIPLPQNDSTSDKFMETLMTKHGPRWIANYHEHETLLQENEDEKLSKEEQDLAWETFQRTMEWEEVQRIIPKEESSYNGHRDHQNPVHSRRQHRDHHRHEDIPQQPKVVTPIQRKCSNLSHLLTLRSQGTKAGSSMMCGECSQEICWENLNRDAKSR
ncbi:P-loop containing nucleoside triphosphate hydrolases superfamily protein [Wolffia australiana]